jgi:hypothetical protein
MVLLSLASTPTTEVSHNVPWYKLDTLITIINFIDTATITDSCVTGVDNVCVRYEGNDTGEEPEKLGSGADGTVCFPVPYSLGVWRGMLSRIYSTASTTMRMLQLVKEPLDLSFIGGGFL